MSEPTQQPQKPQQPDIHHQPGVPQQSDPSQPDPSQNQNAASPKTPQQQPQFMQGPNRYSQYPTQQFGAPQIPQQKVTKKLDVKVLFIVLAALFACSTIFMGIRYVHASQHIDALDQQVDDLTADKKRLQGELSGTAPDQEDDSSGSTDDNDTDTDGDSSEEDGEGKIGDTLESAGIQMKLTKAADASSISYDTCGDSCSNGKYAPKKPDKGTKYWVANVEITNNSKAPIDITCGYPLKIEAVNTDNQHYTPIDDLYQVQGNPECNAELQPGLSSKMSYVFAIPSKTTIAGIAFSGIDENLDEGEQRYFIVKDDYTFFSE
ncbi:MAG: hypothetical protein LKJ44_01825 [Bifidobacteriaceae bacterium]|nr:hypothetical protein [Bifidobacteriaceae bacterium]